MALHPTRQITVDKVLPGAAIYMPMHPPFAKAHGARDLAPVEWLTGAMKGDIDQAIKVYVSGIILDLTTLICLEIWPE